MMRSFWITAIFALMTLVASAETPPAQDTLASPNKFHFVLSRLSGKWETKGKVWPNGPEGKSVAAQGKSFWQMRVDDHVLMITDSLAWKGGLWEGAALAGYNNATKRYEMSLLESRQTALQHYEGTADTALKLLSLESLAADTLSPRRVIDIRVINGNHHVVTFWNVFPNGSRIKQREIEYKRER